MLVPGYPDGVEPIDIIKDLRRVKTSQKVRTIALHLDSEYKKRNLSVEEAGWLRSAARRYMKKIEELHQSMDRARLSIAADKMGRANFAEVHAAAQEQTRRNRLRRLKIASKQLSKAEEDKKDFGI